MEVNRRDEEREIENDRWRVEMVADGCGKSVRSFQLVAWLGKCEEIWMISYETAVIIVWGFGEEEVDYGGRKVLKNHQGRRMVKLKGHAEDKALLMKVE
jgi:hypothetical protein